MATSLSPKWKKYLVGSGADHNEQASTLLQFDGEAVGAAAQKSSPQLQHNTAVELTSPRVTMAAVSVAGADAAADVLHVARPLQSVSVQDKSPVAFSADGTRAALVVASHAILVLQLEAGAFKVHQLLNGHTASVKTLLFHPLDANILCSGGQEGVVCWHINSHTVAAHIPGARYSTSALGGAVVPGGHEGDVECMVWCYDGATLVTGGKDAIIKAWDWSGPVPRLLEAVTGHKSAILALAFHAPTGKLASAGRDSTVKVWDVSTLSMEWRAKRSDDGGITVGLLGNLDGHRGDVTSLAWSAVPPTTADTAAGQTPPPVLLSGARDNRIIAWNIITWTEQREIKDSIMAARGVRSQHHSDVRRIGLLPDGLHALSASTDGTVKVWKLGHALPPAVPPSAGGAGASSAGGAGVPTGDLLSLGDAGAGTGVGGGTTAAAAAQAASDAEDDVTRTLLEEILGSGSSAGLSRGGRIAATAADALLATVPVTSDAELGVMDMAVNPTRPIVAISSAANSVTLYALRPDVLPWLSRTRDGSLPPGSIPAGTDLTPLVPVQGFHGHSGTVMGVSLSPDDSTLYSCSMDQSVCSYDARVGSRKAQYMSSAAALCVAVLPAVDSNGQPMGKGTGLVFVGGADYTIRAYAADPAAYSQLRDAYARLPTPRTPPPFEYEAARYVGHAGRVDALALHPTGEVLVSGARDFTICVWSLTDPAPVIGRGPPRDEDDIPRVAPLSRFAAHKGHVTGLSFSSAALGSLLASSGSDHVLQVWKVGSGGGLGAVWKSGSVEGGGHASAVACTVWGQPATVPAGPSDTTVAGISDLRELLYSGGWDGSIKVWSGKNPARAPVGGASGSASLLGSTEVVPLRTLAGHTARVTGLSISADGTLLVSASGDRTARVWSIRSGPACLAVYHASTSEGPLSCVSAGLTVFATGGDAGVSLWPLRPAGPFAALFTRGQGGRTTTVVSHEDVALVTGHGGGPMRLAAPPMPLPMPGGSSGSSSTSATASAATTGLISVAPRQGDVGGTDLAASQPLLSAH